MGEREKERDRQTDTQRQGKEIEMLKLLGNERSGVSRYKPPLHRKFHLPPESVCP